MLIPDWNRSAWQQLTGDSQRSTHAWLLAGPEGLGKQELGVRYASRLLGDPDNFETASNPDFHVLMPERDADPGGPLLQRYAMRYYLTAADRKAKAIISVDQSQLLLHFIIFGEIIHHGGIAPQICHRNGK